MNTTRVCHNNAYAIGQHPCCGFSVFLSLLLMLFVCCCDCDDRLDCEDCGTTGDCPRPTVAGGACVVMHWLACTVVHLCVCVCTRADPGEVHDAQVLLRSRSGGGGQHRLRTVLLCTCLPCGPCLPAVAIITVCVCVHWQLMGSLSEECFTVGLPLVLKWLPLKRDEDEIALVYNTVLTFAELRNVGLCRLIVSWHDCPLVCVYVCAAGDCARGRVAVVIGRIGPVPQHGPRWRQGGRHPRGHQNPHRTHWHLHLIVGPDQAFA